MTEAASRASIVSASVRRGVTCSRSLTNRMSRSAWAASTGSPTVNIGHACRCGTEAVCSLRGLTTMASTQSAGTYAGTPGARSRTAATIAMTVPPLRRTARALS